MKHLKLIKSLTLSLIIISSAVFSPYSSAQALSIDREAVRAEMITSNPFHEQEILMEDLILPRNLYILKGDSTHLSRLTLYYKNLVLSPHNDYTLQTSSSFGKSVLGRWFYESPISGEVSPSSAFDLNFSLVTPTTSIIKSTSVEIVDSTDETPVRLLAIGDSLTRMGGYIKHLQNLIPNVTSVGTISYPGETIAREGRGGWTFNKYFNFIGLSENLDSPFVFPSSVSGTHYKGNTANWKKIYTAHPSDTLYSGLQKMARGWKDYGPYLYDENGYFKYPAIGDVMVDPSFPEGSKWIKWNGISWSPLKVQPTHFEVNFTKYMERFADAYTSGAPTHISILLGANDFGTYDTLMDMPGFLSYLEQFIASIHEYDPSIKIIICTPTLSPNQNLLTGDTSSYSRYNRNMKLATYYLLKTYDNDESLSKNIYIAPMTLTLDTTNGFDYTTTQSEIDSILTTTVTAANSIHPNDYGNILMGNTLAAVIQKFRH